jgi:ankyrin repeat protein
MNEWLELFKNNDYIGVKKYLKNGADIDETNDIGEGVLACAMRAGCDIDLVMLLIENGADIFDFDDEGVSVFDMAITYNYIDIVNYLIEKGFDINKTTRKSGFTPLMTASCYGRVDIVKILLEQDVDQSAVDMKGFSAADFARKMNKKSVLELLDYNKEDPKNTNFTR